MDKAPTAMNPSLIDKPLPFDDTALVDAVKACQVNCTIPVLVEKNESIKPFGVTIFPFLFDSSTRGVEYRGSGRIITHSSYPNIGCLGSISRIIPQKSPTVIKSEQFAR